MQSNLLERVNAQNLESSMEASGHFQFLLQDRHQQVCRHCCPDLGFHRIRACSIVTLDPEIPLDPLEKQFDLPAILLGIEKPNPPQRRRKVFPRFGQRQIPDLIAPKPRCFVHNPRLLPGETQIFLGAAGPPPGFQAGKFTSKAGFGFILALGSQDNGGRLTVPGVPC